MRGRMALSFVLHISRRTFVQPLVWWRAWSSFGKMMSLVFTCHLLALPHVPS